MPLIAPLRPRRGKAARSLRSVRAGLALAGAALCWAAGTVEPAEGQSSDTASADQAVTGDPARHRDAAVKDLTRRDPVGALAEANKGVDAARKSGDAYAEDRLLLLRGGILDLLQRTSQAEATFDEAAVAAHRAADVEGEVGARARRALLLFLDDAASSDMSAALDATVAAAAGAPPNQAAAARRALGQAASLFVDHGRLTEAQQLWNGAIALQSATQPVTLDMAGDLCDRGEQARLQHNVPAARAYLEQALAIDLKLAPTSADCGVAACRLGAALLEARQLRGAQVLSNLACDILAKSTPASADYGLCRMTLGALAEANDDYPGALNDMQAAVAVLQTARPDSADLALARAQLCALLRRAGKVAEARDAGEAALSYFGEHAPGSEQMAVCLLNLAEVDAMQGDLARARSLGERALAITDGGIGVARADLRPVNAALWDLSLRALRMLGSACRDAGDTAAADRFEREEEARRAGVSIALFRGAGPAAFAPSGDSGRIPATAGQTGTGGSE